MTLVSIPWQPQLFVHPDFLDKLTQASETLGRDILLGDDCSPQGEWLAAWRSRAGTVYLWDGWINKLPGFSTASNPDNGPRSHQRGVGGDLESWPADVYAALVGAGIQINAVPGEPWHIQLPNFMTYPIIDTNTATASSNATPLTTATVEEQDMDMLFLYVDNDGNGKPFWTLLNTKTGKFFPPAYTQSVANGWATVWGSARSVVRQEFLNAVNAIQNTL